MSQIQKTYDLKSCQLIVGGIKVGGYAEDGAVEFEYDDPDEHTITVGTDGESVASRSNNTNMTVTISLMETSRSVRLLAGLWQTQRKLSPMPPLDFYFRDPLIGDEVSSSYATFTTRPVIVKGKTVSSRVFRLSLPGAVDTMVLGANNLI